MMEAGLFAGIAAAATAFAHARRRHLRKIARVASPAPNDSTSQPLSAGAAAVPAPSIGSLPAPREIIAEPEAYEATVNAIVAGGTESLLIILDFDRTITTCFHDEAHTVRGATCHGIVEATRGAELLEKAHALNKKYYPLETDPDLPLDRKVPLMEEWYTQVHQLLLEDGMRLEDIKSSVAVANLSLRAGVVEIFDWCERYAVPLLVFSAGIGDVLAEVLRQRLPRGMPRCAHIVSNTMVFDAGGRLTGFSDPLIHMFNKNGSALSSATLRALSDRPHVLVGGDSLGDATMAQGLPSVAHELRWGLLNEAVERLLPQYTSVFDVVLTHDAPLTPLLDVLTRIAP